MFQVTEEVNFEAVNKCLFLFPLTPPSPVKVYFIYKVVTSCVFPFVSFDFFLEILILICKFNKKLCNYFLPLYLSKRKSSLYFCLILWVVSFLKKSNAVCLKSWHFFKSRGCFCCCIWKADSDILVIEKKMLINLLFVILPKPRKVGNGTAGRYSKLRLSDRMSMKRNLLMLRLLIWPPQAGVALAENHSRIPLSGKSSSKCPHPKRLEDWKDFSPKEVSFPSEMPTLN